MANLQTGGPGIIVKGSAGPATAQQNLTAIDSSAVVPVGTRSYDDLGNEYIYLQGVASTVAGSVVTFNRNTGATTLVVTNAIGPVAVAKAATVANTFGWYQIYGVGTAACDTIASGTACYIDGTAGRIDDAVVAGDLIAGMFSRSTDSSNLCTVELFYPFCTDTLS